MNAKKILKIIFAVALFPIVIFFVARMAEAATNINSGTASHWAWNDLIGWINFYNTLTVNVNSPSLTGYASSSASDISLDCHTTSAGNVCGSSNYQVKNDGLGNLSSWAWNDQYGWISFCGGLGTGDCPGSTRYEVLINPTTGDFSNYAWNDVIGWISFNCTDPGVCGTSQYKVNTSWTATSTSGYLDSATYDTGVVSGAQLNSVLWHGNLPGSGALVQFQFATSNSSSGPWTFVGSGGSTNAYYSVAPDITLKLDYSAHNNRRYFRYRVTLVSNQAQTQSPRIDEIIVNWSP